MHLLWVKIPNWGRILQELTSTDLISETVFKNFLVNSVSTNPKIQLKFSALLACLN